MTKILGSLTAAVFAAAALTAQTAPGPYSGQESREIKALGAEEIAALEAGEGMGFAKAAELNQYPGPKHVLELAKELKLTADQSARTREIHRKMREEAVALGRAIVQKERALDRLFAGRRITPESLSKATAEIARLEGELRATHLKAHLETRALLTPEQITAYDSLRGYGKGEHTGHAHGGVR